MSGLDRERAPTRLMDEPVGGGSAPSVVAELERREAELVERARALRHELTEAGVEAARARAALEAREALDAERAAREASLLEELAALRAQLREARERKVMAVDDLAALEEEVAEQRDQISALKRERRVLANRAAKLDELRASRGHRVVRLVWRVSRALRRPARRLRRRVEG